MYVVRDSSGEVIGAFNEFNWYFIREDVKLGFVSRFSQSFDDAIEWLKKNGLIVEVVK